MSISDAISSGKTTAVDAALNLMTNRFACTRTVSDPKPNMRLINVTVTWKGNDGRAHSVVTQSR